MSNHTERELLLNLTDKVDDLREKVHDIDITIAKQEINLKEHMRRTEAIEKEHEFFKKEVKPALNAYKFMSVCMKLIFPIITAIGIYFKYFK